MTKFSDTMLRLARPFADRYVKKNPSGGGTYVSHDVVEQRLIAALGIPPTFELKEIVRGHVPAIEPDPNARSERGKRGAPALNNAVVGVVARMTLGDLDTIVEEAGDCEDPHNWPHDGARMKDAMSDAYKRCAMRLGCGLHLWSQEDFFLYDRMLKDNASVATAGTPESPLLAESGSVSPAPGGTVANESGEQAPDGLNTGTATLQGVPPGPADAQESDGNGTPTLLTDAEPPAEAPTNGETAKGDGGVGRGSAPRATRAQLTKLQVVAQERGLQDRTTRLAAACTVLAGHGFPERAGNGLTSFNELSAREAHALIDAWGNGA